ncbi:MAG: hypothetical protein DHS20C21_18470 [Gemmatimonadota bacterium]|nr:MAG: hypothetical protein DHS20C21_18470 [Gemmatimonadota bacterium]
MSTVFAPLTSRDVEAVFTERLDDLGGEVPQIVTELTRERRTDRGKESYQFVGTTPRLTKFIGTREGTKPRLYGFDHETEIYDAALEFTKDELRRDRTGILLDRTRELADDVPHHWYEYFTDLLEKGNVDGEYGVAFDTYPLFSANHVWGDSGAMSNSFNTATNLNTVVTGGSIDNLTSDQLRKIVMNAISKMCDYRDDEGRPRINAGAKRFKCMFPKEFFAVAQEAFGNRLIATGGTNTIIEMNSSGWAIDFEINPWLSASNVFFLFRTDTMKPAIGRIIEEEAQLIDVAGGSEREKLQRKHIYIVESIHGMGYEFWPSAARVQLAAA